MMAYAAKILALINALLLSACAANALQGRPGPAAEGELVVFAAASLTEAFTEIGAAFEKKQPGIQVVFNFAGSQQLAQQLMQGARADVFASANQNQMRVALDANHIREADLHIFALNRLVIVLPRDNPGAVADLDDLARPGLKVVLAAESVPVGQYALVFLERAAADPNLGAAYRAGVLANVVSYEQTVKAVFNKVQLGEADAGIVYTSDVSANAQAQTQTIEIPAALNPVAEYPLAPAADSSQPELARQFVDFVLSPRGQDILAQHGFSSAP